MSLATIFKLSIFKFLLERLQYPGDMKNKGCAKFWGADKVYYGRSANGE